MCLPLLIAFGSILTYPVARAVELSFYDWNLGLGSKRFVGIANYLKIILRDDYFRNSLKVTGIFTVSGVFLNTGGAVLLAQAFQKKFRAKRIIMPLILLPMFISSVVISMTWKAMFHPTVGVFNYLLELVHLPPSTWIYTSGTVIPSLILFNFWVSVPYGMLLMAGGFAMLPKSPFEAAKIEGASGPQIFWHITLPLLSPILFTTLVLQTIMAIKVFGPVYAMTGGGPAHASEVLYMYTYRQAFTYGRIGYGAAVGTVLFLIVLLATAVLVLIDRRLKY